jgi:hypothetical protein
MWIWRPRSPAPPTASKPRTRNTPGAEPGVRSPPPKEDGWIYSCYPLFPIGAGKPEEPLGQGRGPVGKPPKGARSRKPVN